MGAATLLLPTGGNVMLAGGGAITLAGGTISGTGGTTLTNTDNTISGFGQIGLGNPNVLNLTNAAAGTIEAIGGTLTIKINSPIENAGLLEAASGATLQINVGTIHNTGDIDVYGTLAAAQPTANGGMLKLTGGGNTTLIGGTITTTLSGETLENSGNTIAGYGQIGDGIVSLNLQNDAAATINGNSAADALIVHTGNAITNNGTLEANGGTLHIVDAVTGTGSAMITGGGTLQIDAAYAQTVTFSGIGGTLLLHGPSAFTGTIAGISGSVDVLDLTGFDNAATVSYSGTSSSGTLTVSEGATTIHLSVAGTTMGTFVTAGLDSGGTGLLIHDPATDPADQHAVADGTLDGAAASDTIDIASQGNYSGALTASPNDNGGVDWHFAASDDDIIQQAGQTQYYSIHDATTPSASQALSVSIGSSGQDQFQFSSGSGAHALIDFSTSSDASGHYAGDTVNLVNFSNDHGGSLTLNDILADLTTDSHGNAVVNLGHGDSIVFEHIAAAVIQSQIDQGHPVFTLGVNQA